MNSTTINIDKDIYLQLSEASYELGISVSEIIKKIIFLMTQQLDDKDKIFGLIRYQGRSVENEWKCFHINFTENECRINFNARSAYRISLSKLILVGFFLFWDEIIRSYKHKNTREMSKLIDSYTSFITINIHLIESECFFIKKLAEHSSLILLIHSSKMFLC